ncbi:MAG: sulfotransferase domain-containing protein [Rhizomicrobium sp.]
MPAPNFLIVGAPKCGTTALSEYLRGHPQVFMCQPKEPHYFADDFPNHRCVDSWDAYLDLFSGATSEQRAIGEASVFYLYSGMAIPSVIRRIPHARLVILLRNPIDIAISMHAQCLYNMEENIAAFEEAWRACNSRRRGERLPNPCREPKTLLYDQLALLGQQLERVLAAVPACNVRWWFYDDLARSPRDLYAEVLDFLGLHHDGRTGFPPINERKRHRVLPLARFTETPPKPLVALALGIKRVVPLRKWGILEALREANMQRMSKDNEVNGTLRREMRWFFDSDLRLLSGITGRNLDHWV